MRIGDIDIQAVQPTRTGLYLVRRKNASFTGVGVLHDIDGKKFFRFEGGRMTPAEAFECYGPLMFSGQADKVHTTYKVDLAWKDQAQIGTPGRI